MNNFKPCPECKSPMTDSYDHTTDELYWKCAWCGCERDYLTRRILQHGNDEKVAECQKEADAGALAAAYRQGFLAGRKSIRNMRKQDE